MLTCQHYGLWHSCLWGQFNVTCSRNQSLQNIWKLYIYGFVQERHNSIANTLELCLSCTNPLICLKLQPHLPWVDNATLQFIELDDAMNISHHTTVLQTGNYNYPIFLHRCYGWSSRWWRNVSNVIMSAHRITLGFRPLPPLSWILYGTNSGTW